MTISLAHWKSSLSSILTAGLATTSAFLAPPLNTLIQPKHVLWIGAGQVIGKIWIGLITQDADKTLATTPAHPEPHVVDAHPTPDDPSATPVQP